jgi:flagellar hook-basal body complex protein FliE
MQINFNPNISGPMPARPVQGTETTQSNQADFGKAMLKSLESANQDQTEANASILDLLSGKQQDINTVVASVAKADMSFKLLVGVRNKLVEAYKETMRMQV